MLRLVILDFLSNNFFSLADSECPHDLYQSDRSMKTTGLRELHLLPLDRSASILMIFSFYHVLS